ncbi:uncharacterized protein F5Z01DRAFT_632559 [Emericellopsis atlantica]|uniref:Uncharacterized protein n=1 Tax=Emericellopsis atlantica TaxID=2614577 RepID=A0A9P7ZVG3_9HYPO|nr:uncharacterized protein F5Z01DRAFT_632559 [Emericellopsis atlantica]KAG9258482.1 hypothetical protein F5Z01DRAFT_632559 [Emericellopsis atlantica]
MTSTTKHDTGVQGTFPWYKFGESVAAAVGTICPPDGSTQSDTNEEYYSVSAGDVSDSSDQSIDVDRAITTQLESESQQFVQTPQSSTLPNHAFDIGFKAIDKITTKTTLDRSSPPKTPLAGFHPGKKRLTPVTPPRQTMNRSPDSIRSNPYDIECTSDSDMDSGPIPLNFLDVPKRDGFKTPILTKTEERRSARMAGSGEDSPMARKSRKRVHQAQPIRHSEEAQNSSKPINGKSDRLMTPDPTPNRPAQGEGTALRGPWQQDGQQSSSSSDESNGSPVWKIGTHPSLPATPGSAVSVAGDRMAVRYSPYPKSRLKDFLKSSLRVSRAVSGRNRASPLTSDTRSLDTVEREPHTTKSETYMDSDTRRHNQHENAMGFGLISPQKFIAESVPDSSSYPFAEDRKLKHITGVPIIPEDAGHEPSAGESLIEAQGGRKTMSSSLNDAAEAKSVEKRDMRAMPTFYTLQPSYGQCKPWLMDKPGPYLPHHRDTLTNLRSILKGSELWKRQKSFLASEQAGTHQLGENKDVPVDRIPKRRRRACQGCREGFLL